MIIYFHRRRESRRDAEYRDNMVLKDTQYVPTAVTGAYAAAPLNEQTAEYYEEAEDYEGEGGGPYVGVAGENHPVYGGGHGGIGEHGMYAGGPAAYGGGMMGHEQYGSGASYAFSGLDTTAQGVSPGEYAMQQAARTRAARASGSEVGYGGGTEVSYAQGGIGAPPYSQGYEAPAAVVPVPVGLQPASGAPGLQGVPAPLPAPTWSLGF